MTEAEWLCCGAPLEMLQDLKGGVNDRKLRLFACACVRQAWPVTGEEESVSVEVAEQFADGLATAEELAAARNRVWWPLMPWARGNTDRTGLVRAAVNATTSPAGWSAAVNAANAAARLSGRLPDTHAHQAALIRCIFGPLPFRPVEIAVAVLSWKARTVPRLARSIYDGRAFPDLPVLADALEEAGCSDSEILDHCRGPGPHIRGCWVLDFVLGKE